MSSVIPDVLIIGGGIIGVCTAYYLARQGISVTVVDKGEIGSGSSYGNAGLLCPCHSTPIALPGVLSQGLKWLLDAESPFYIKPRLDSDLARWLWLFRGYCNQAAMDTAVPLLRDMQRASLELYRQVISQEQLDCFFAQTGGLMLFHTAEALEHGQREAAYMQQFGLELSVLDGAETRALEPVVHPRILGAIYHEEDAFLSPHLFLQGLTKAAAARGVTFLPQTEVMGFEKAQQQITSVLTSRGRIRAGQVVLAAGGWTAVIARLLGVTFPLQPAKGYSITIHRPAPLPRRYLYLAETKVAITPMGDKLRYAGTLELAGFDFTINQRRVRAIRRAAAAYLVTSGDETILETWRGMRPCSPDGLPYIGRSRQITNLVIGTGHATLGMSMGPVTGRLLAEVLQEKRPSIPLQPFRVERFG